MGVDAKLATDEGRNPRVRLARCDVHAAGSSSPTVGRGRALFERRLGDTSGGSGDGEASDSDGAELGVALGVGGGETVLKG